MRPHFPLLVSLKNHVAPGQRGAGQYKSRRTVFRKIGGRCRLIDLAPDKARRASQALALTAHRRQVNACSSSSVEDKLTIRACDDLDSSRRLEFDPEGMVFMDCRSPGSCCRALHQVRLAGSGRKERTCRRVQRPAVQ